VIPLKPLALAKSRLAPVTGDRVRPELALAFAADTVEAALNCPVVGNVAVVTDDPRAAAELAALGALIVPDLPRSGLNAALEHGARTVRAPRPAAPVAALNADLPALRPAELARTLTWAAHCPRAFLADADGIGTTLLTAAGGTELRPRFGGPSRRAHSMSGAVEIPLDGVDSVRRDVDTAGDLAAALALGAGPRTAALAAALAAGRPRADGPAGPDPRGAAGRPAGSGTGPAAAAPACGSRSGPGGPRGQGLG
jgi:2-phospho-L-lactate/phosphoenolpyruvate guanylyltransferase